MRECTLIKQAFPEGLKLRWTKAHVTRTPREAGPDDYVDTFSYNDAVDGLEKSAAKGGP